MSELLMKGVHLKQYEEAAEWLSSVAEESQKTSNVDLDKMIAGCTSCLSLVQQLKEKEEDVKRKAALGQLCRSLQSSLQILRDKKTHVETGTLPETPETKSSPKAAKSRRMKRERPLRRFLSEIL